MVLQTIFSFLKKAVGGRAAPYRPPERQRPSWTRSPQKIILSKGRGGNPFPLEKLSEKIMLALQMKATREFHHNLYKRVSHDRAINEKRGKKFELLIYKFLQEKQSEDPHLKIIEREKWLSSDSRVDFFLEWRLPDGGKLVALLECKHSIKVESRLCRMEDGLAQLKRYRRRCPGANFLILVVDFHLPFFSRLPFTTSRDDEILIINYGALHILFDEIADFMFVEARTRKQKNNHRDTRTTRFKEFPVRPKEEKILDLDTLVASLEGETPNKCERKSAHYKALLEFFREKLGENTKAEFEIDFKELRDRMGVDEGKYRSGGQFQPAHFKFNCLTPNIKKLERNEKIKTELFERRKNGLKTLFFKIERLEAYEEEKRSENNTLKVSSW